MINRLFSFKSIASVVIGYIILLEIYLTSLHSYLLFHTIVEMISIIIGCGIAMLAWNSRHFMGNAYLMLLGIANEQLHRKFRNGSAQNNGSSRTSIASLRSGRSIWPSPAALISPERSARYWSMWRPG